MGRIGFFLAVFILLQAAGTVMAAKIITVDPQSGEVSVVEQGEEAPAAEEKPAACPQDEEEIGRLREVVRRQQGVILRQQAFIEKLRNELRHKDNIILGLEQLRRQGR